MIKTTVTIDGMMCAMCENHINDTIRQNFQVKKVTSSHSRGICEIISEAPVDDSALRSKIGETGYKVTKIESAPYEKKRFSLFGR